MRTELIDTAPAGAELLTTDIATSKYLGEGNAVVAATERLRDCHTKGYVNSDAFSGDFVQHSITSFMGSRSAGAGADSGGQTG